MSEKFDYVNECYSYGFWTEYQVKKAVKKNWITPEEFKSITGNEYAE